MNGPDGNDADTMITTMVLERYGKSEGTPTEDGLLLDVEASLRALRDSPKSGVDPDKIFLFGRSLGGAVALAGADRYPDLVRRYLERSRRFFAS